MRFIDEAIIEVYAGNGGDGCVSFCREKYRPKGGPDGGDGGRGGNVIVTGTTRVATLADHSYLRHFKAKRGTHGMGSQKKRPQRRGPLPQGARGHPDLRR